MKKIARQICLVIFVLFFNSISFAKLSNQQINLLLENDDAQIFTLTSDKVKKSKLSIQGINDNTQGKTITQYDRNGLLINYYSASLMALKLKEQNTMITTLMRNKDYQWQRKQTIGDYQLDNSIYMLKDELVQITRFPSYRVNNERLILQKNTPIDDTQALRVTFNYQKPQAEKQLDIEYYFDSLGRLNSFNFTSVDENDPGYTSIIKTQFEYDALNRLIKGNTSIHYQSQGEEGNNITSEVTYSDFDYNGNWLTKTVLINGETTVYKRNIEYW